MRTRIATLALCLLPLAGCPEEEPLSASEFIGLYPAAFCDYLFRCCDAAERSFGSKPNCLGAKEAEVKDLLAFASVEQAFARFDPDSGQSCLDALADKDCNAATKERGCLAKATLAQHKSGEDCVYSSECTSYYCIQPQKNTKGYCAESSGGECSGDDRACGKDGYCSSSRQCLGKLDTAKACTRGEECQSGICSPQYKTCVAAPSPLCDGR